ncbi:MAG: hypothetical protein QOK15_1681, partial [Nocardioidaceae bacterium]|nr:hypothetical protein [Nocardioidaceae bacterium]
RVGTQSRTATTPTTSTTSASSSRWPLVLLGVLLVALLLALPWGVRGLVRRRRYASADPGDLAERCWAELRGTAVDLGHGWDDGATLRRRARDLVPTLADSTTEDPVQSLERLVLLVERSRYSRTGLSDGDAEGLVKETRTVTGAMYDAAGTGRRRRARWLPRSLWQGRRKLTTRAAADRGGVVQLERLSV